MPTRYTFIPTFNFNDTQQVVDTVEEAKAMAEAFLAKFGGEDCRSVTVVEIKPVGELEYVAPIWHDVRVPN